MGNRLDLQAMLEELLGSDEVYFQPPASVKMKYPAIVYSRSNIENVRADDSVYRQLPEYEVIVIDNDPDSKIVFEVSRLKYCRFERHYTADGLDHDVFKLNY